MHMPTILICLMIGLAASAASDVIEAGSKCMANNFTYTAKVNYHGGELGKFQFEECGDAMNPTLYFEVGKTYTVVQKDRSNWFHPMGLAYSSYGDEEIKLDLDPSISKNPDSHCSAILTCPAPMYFLNDQYLGVYSNLPELQVTVFQKDIGFQPYISAFANSIHEWAAKGTFSLKIRFDDENLQSDLFYFCRIHEFMGGRIKLMKNGTVLNELDVPSMGYDQDQPSDFDTECGTFGLGDYELPHPSCPDKFVCSAAEDTESLKSFTECIDATNCHMFSGMTTGSKASSPGALFVHQMIPHHQNAVNMAKAVFKARGDPCVDISNAEDLECLMSGVLRSVINVQNHEIQDMYDYLDSIQAPPEDKCVVEVETTSVDGRDSHRRRRI